MPETVQNLKHQKYVLVEHVTLKWNIPSSEQKKRMIQPHEDIVTLHVCTRDTHAHMQQKHVSFMDFFFIWRV